MAELEFPMAIEDAEFWPPGWKSASGQPKEQAGSGPGEADPTGRNQHEPGAKLDAGKNRCGLVIHGFAGALEEVSRIGTFGANKYTPNGWRSVPNGQERYTDALYRHLLKEAQGEELDPDSGLLHAAHAAWNALARLQLQLDAATTNASKEGKTNA